MVNFVVYTVLAILFGFNKKMKSVTGRSYHDKKNI